MRLEDTIRVYRAGYVAGLEQRFALQDAIVEEMRRHVEKMQLLLDVLDKDAESRAGKIG